MNTFQLLFYNTDQPARHNKDKDAAKRVMEVWFDDIVLATGYIGPIQGAPANGKKIASVRRKIELPSLPETIVYSQSFDNGAGKFKGGDIRDGAVSFPKQVSAWGAFSTQVKDTTTVRFRIKALADIGSVMIQSWSQDLKDNCRTYITNLPKGEWREVRFRAADIRQGMEADGPSLQGKTFNNISLIFSGPKDARILLDDFEIRE